MKRFIAALIVLAAVPGIAMAQDSDKKDGPNVLYLSKSAGFQHSVVQAKGDIPSLTDTVLTNIVKDMGGTITATKDASLVNAENLKNYDLVIFYTTGDLTEPGFDRTVPMGEDGPEALFDWIKAGGGFVGFHSATDTFHSEGDTPSDYVQMIGGEFAGHGPQFYGTLRVVSPDHPAMANFEDGWKIKDEWYFFKHLNTENMHVLALLDSPEQLREKDERYAGPNYPIVWCSSYGDGRVFYNAMGHREDVWENEAFQATVKDALQWANGHGEAMTDPNYNDVVPKE
jgi:hypothetical protein